VKGRGNKRSFFPLEKREFQEGFPFRLVRNHEETTFEEYFGKLPHPHE
jgi:hypothetical protein